MGTRGRFSGGPTREIGLSRFVLRGLWDAILEALPIVIILVVFFGFSSHTKLEQLALVLAPTVYFAALSKRLRVAIGWAVGWLRARLFGIGRE